MRRNEQTLDGLRALPDLAPAAPRRLRPLAQLVDEVTVDAGRVLVVEGELGHECMVVLDGEAVVTIGGREFARVHPGEFIGEMAMISGKVRCATVTAATPMRLLVIGPKAFDAFADTPLVANAIGKQLSRRIREVQSAQEAMS